MQLTNQLIDYYRTQRTVQDPAQEHQDLVLELHVLRTRNQLPRKRLAVLSGNLAQT